MLENEFNFFKEHQEELVAKYPGRVVVIQGRKVIGVFPTPLEAYVETQKKHKIGSFFIQTCEPGPDAYTATISSVELSSI
jgi:hypothetical protein